MLEAYPKKLEEKLDDYEQGYLACFDNLLKEDLDNIEFNYKDNLDDDVKFFKTIKKEVADQVFDYIRMAIKCLRTEHQVCFIESNHYSIDEHGNVVDDNLKNNKES